ncbi:MAG: COX15/CtaA family protein [Magnetococcales bacterium]|nr:COX15/CtaA family protein [Magnetococcales bacterium]
MVLAMVILGGVTRLTGSGLSMVNWAPITGWLPPLSPEAWQQVFALYQQTPEFRLINSTMDVAGFKGIFWLEYIHRLVGRLTGVVFLLPMLYFAWCRQIDRPLFIRLVLLFLLGALQGGMGWYMVASGLVDQPHVSHYRLTAHLGMACLIYGYMLWLALDLWFAGETATSPPMAPCPKTLHLIHQMAFLIAVTSFVTLLAGGLVAGLKAGLAYNTFPLMGGRWIPEEYWLLSGIPAWLNLFDNVAAVQWNHRWLATLTVLLVMLLWVMSRRRPVTPRVNKALHALLLMALVQFSLGIATLLSYVALPLASLHQTGALILLTIALFTVHQSGRTASTSL